MKWNKALVIFISALTTFYCSTVFSEIYKCRQPSGVFSYQDEPCDGGAREYDYQQKHTIKLNLPAIYKSSYNTSSDFAGLSPKKVVESRCLKLCFKNAMACGLQCADNHTNMSSAKPCFMQCKRGTRNCTELCTYR